MSTYWYEHLKVPEFRRVLWVLGTTHSGKSTVARKIAAETGAIHLEGSKWVRQMHAPDCGVAELTATAMSILHKDERYFSRLIREDLERGTREPGSRVVFAGSRNPFDFVDNFDVQNDAAILVGVESCPPQSVFEEFGLEAIRAHLRFVQATGLVLSNRVVSVEPVR